MHRYQSNQASCPGGSNRTPVDDSDPKPQSTHTSSLPTLPEAETPSYNPSFDSDTDGHCLYTDGDFSHAVLKYINDILMEENLEDRNCMPQDSLALQAAEKTFYDALFEEYPSSSHQSAPCLDQNIVSPDEIFTSSISVESCCTSSSGLAESVWFSNQSEAEFCLLQSSHCYSPRSSLLVPESNRELLRESQFVGLTGNSVKSLPYSNFVDIPATSKLAVPPEVDEEVAAKNAEVDAGYNYSSNWSKGRKHRHHEDNDCPEEDEGSSKHFLGSTEEAEQLEIMDNSFLDMIEKRVSIPCPLYDSSRNEASKKLQSEEQLLSSNTRIKRMTQNNETVDLWTLLIQCAQAAGSGDQMTAYLILKQIRQHSSPFGNGNQRLAHYFANGIEARLAGTGKSLYAALAGSPASAVDMLKAQQLYCSILPFRKMTNTFANRTIARVAGKATRVHVIDFGISYGVQWPCFMHRLSARPGGPPKIRITGIDLPQPGFRLAERIEDTGRRLKRLADRLKVPFEYHTIAQRWENIRYEDLKINKDEVVAVNSMCRFRHLPDDTMVLDSPRDAVLNLIKQINPDIFLQGIVNGSHNAPFFVTRFREALFHFSACFDMFEANAPREDRERLMYEREVFGNEAMNVIACEGTDRVERPEIYKQWQARNSRIGFRQLPLYRDIVKRVRNIKSDYHKDFTIDEDGDWLLLGWKGRTLHAFSAWKPVHD